MKENHGINKGSISGWIAYTAYTIRLAYKNFSKSKQALIKIKARELRALSATGSYCSKTLVEEVIKAAVWSCRSTFTKFYLRDLNRHTKNLRLLGPVVTAQKVVGDHLVFLTKTANLKRQSSKAKKPVQRYLNIICLFHPGIEMVEI